jgi:hypothetical protein
LGHLSPTPQFADQHGSAALVGGIELRERGLQREPCRNDSSRSRVARARSAAFLRLGVM